ncbi:MAG: glycoside hydrolase family 9 protein [Bacteroidales bacterium]|nr:glycoside hydrolase family 9 protein [Bacteroidales bacterium]MCM1417002.1 glycoside hydrolase family 9 protein [bacterium]MCM1424482.1 glycoside hydrolase family 9 protein [bacterium]
MNHTNRKSPFSIFVNQAGYYPDSAKTAVMNFPCETFRIVTPDGVCRYEGKAEPFGHDANSGDDVYRGDFSDFSTEGTYRIISGNETSAQFQISEHVFDRLFCDISKAFYYLRCGCGLEEKYAGVYRHGTCHTAPALLYSDKKTEMDVTGGWHDAGDYGRYVTPGSCAAAHLLYAYKMFPAVFEDLRFGIPESDLPDLLAECRCELEWLMKMQRADGGVYHKATTERHAPFVMPEEDTDPLYVFAISSSATADCGAVCALASGIYARYDRDFAKRLKETAEKSCQWFENHPEFIGFDNPENCNTGCYGEEDDLSNRFWLYAELYALTGEAQYHSKMKEALAADFPLTAMGYSEMGGLGALAYLLCDFEKDAALAERFRKNFRDEAKRLKNAADACGYGCAMEEEDFVWGSNMVLLAHGMVFAVCDYLEKTDAYKNYTIAQMDYLLGVNPTGYSYVTGNGEFCCNYPHLRPAHADGVEACIPGMVSGGPNRVPCDPDAELLIPQGTPPMKCYADDVGCYSLNEITIYWNSPAVFVLGYLYACK